MSRKIIKKYLLIFLGTASMFLGIIGIIFPVLPTTPFLLLTSFCYLRSSERLYNWIMNHKILGSYIYNYLTFRAIKKSTKIGALLFLWISLSFSIYFVSNFYIRIFLLVVGIGVSIHLLKLNTLKEK